VADANRAASLSRDRRTVLYLRREEGGHISLRAASADGQSDVRLFADGSTDCPQLRRPALGPDGTIAVVCSPYDVGDDDFLNIMTTQGKLVKRLDVGQIGDPTFSPDGKRLVYARDRYVPFTYGGALFSVPVDGSAAPTRLVTGSNLNPVWSPKSDEVAYVHLDGKQRSLAAVRVDADGQAGGTQALTTGKGHDQDPSWSPDGSQIAFRRGAQEPHLFVMHADGGSVRRVVRSDGAVTAPVWTAR
jgi:Tol biopolymer transport system component